MKRIPALFATAALAAVSLIAPRCASAQAAAARPDPRAILARVEENSRFDTISYEGSMEIRSGGKSRTKTMKAWSTGSDRALMEFTNPEDRGVRMLKVDTNLWMYFPSERDTVKISGHLLTQGMMGSDLSYEDAMEPDSLLDAYDASWVRTETLGDRTAQVLELSARSERSSYPRRVLWIDDARYVVLRAELYAKSGKLLKETETLEVARIGARWFPTKTLLRDRLKKDSSTVFTMSAVRLDAKLDPGMFTLKALTR